MASKYFIGIDPGLTGSVAIINEMIGVIGLFDTPVLEVVRNRTLKHEHDIGEMVNILRRIASDGVPIVAAIEKVNAMPEQGVTSVFTFGKGFGIWLGILGALGIPVDEVHPTRWKRVMMDGMGKEKDASRLRAKQLFPTADLHLRKHHGRADALLIAEYRRRLG